MVLVGGIERIVWQVVIRWVDRIAGIKAVGRVEGIVGRIGLCGVQGVVRRISTGRIEDVVVALVLLGEARIGKSGRSKEEETAEPYHPHSESPKAIQPVGSAYSPHGEESNRVRKCS